MVDRTSWAARFFSVLVLSYVNLFRSSCALTLELRYVQEARPPTESLGRGLQFSSLVSLTALPLALVGGVQAGQHDHDVGPAVSADGDISEPPTLSYDVDIVIPSALDATGADERESAQRPRVSDRRQRMDDHSLFWVLTGISVNTPWVRNVWILVNGPPGSGVNSTHPGVLPFEAVSPYPAAAFGEFASRIQFVNRCHPVFWPRWHEAGLPLPCPTKNSHSVLAVVHRIPGLAEHFLQIDDDIVLALPLDRRNFFSGPRRLPFVYGLSPEWGPVKDMNDKMHQSGQFESVREDGLMLHPVYLQEENVALLNGSIELPLGIGDEAANGGTLAGTDFVTMHDPAPAAAGARNTTQTGKASKSLPLLPPDILTRPFPMPSSVGPVAVHAPVAMLKSLVTKLVDEFPTFFTWVESHKHGRYSSVTGREDGTSGQSRVMNSQEEELDGIWLAYAYMQDKCVVLNRNTALGTDYRRPLPDDQAEKFFFGGGKAEKRYAHRKGFGQPTISCVLQHRRKIRGKRNEFGKPLDGTDMHPHQLRECIMRLLLQPPKHGSHAVAGRGQLRPAGLPAVLNINDAFSTKPRLYRDQVRVIHDLMEREVFPGRQLVLKTEVD